GLFPDTGEYSSTVAVNGPAMIYVPNSEIGSAHVCSDKTGLRYAGGFNTDKYSAVMSEVGVAAACMPRDIFCFEDQFRVPPGNRSEATLASQEVFDFIKHDHQLVGKIRDFARPSRSHEFHEVEPFISGGADFKPTAVSMGNAVDTKRAPDFDKITAEVSFTWPQVGGPVLSYGEEGWGIDTAVRIGSKVYQSPFLSSFQTKEYPVVSCAYDPRGNKLGTDRLDRVTAFEAALERVLEQVDNAIMLDVPAIVLSDMNADDSEVSIPFIALIPQVRRHILKSGKDVAIIYESQELVSPKDVMIALNIGATAVGFRGLEALAQEKSDVSAVDFYAKCEQCLGFYLASSGISRMMDYVGSYTLRFDVPVAESMEALTGIPGTKNKGTARHFTETDLTRRVLNRQYYKPEDDVDYWQSLVLHRKETNVKALARTLLDLGKRDVGRPGLIAPSEFTQTNPLHVMILGAGQAGITQAREVRGRLQELGIPFKLFLADQQLSIAGLVSKGIHPQKASYRKVGREQLGDLARDTNVHIMFGIPLSNEDLEHVKCHAYVVDARGSSGEPNKLGIEGEDIAYEQGVLTGARVWHQGYTPNVSPDRIPFPIQYDLANPIIAQLGGGGVSIDIARILTAERGVTADINLDFMEELSANRPKVIRLFVRNPDPSRVAFPESDIDKLKKHLDTESIDFRVFYPKSFYSNNGDKETLKGEFLRQFYVDGSSAYEKNASFRVELYCGYTPVVMDPSESELAITFSLHEAWGETDMVTHTVGHAISCVGEKPRESSLPTVGWAKQLSAIDALSAQAQDNTAELIVHNDLGKLSYLVGQGSYLDSLFFRAPFTNVEVLRVLQGIENDDDLTDPAIFYSVVRGASGGVSLDSLSQDSQSDDVKSDFPQAEEGKFVIQDYNGDVHTFSPGDDIFNDLLSKGLIDSPDCGGKGTCSECSVQVKGAIFPEYEGVLGKLATRDGFTLACQHTFSEGVGLLHTNKGGKA
ncbi:hypothetical protein DID76_03580, partial [Candidatus Marinamargulisbacteria bacterium SCGC AG-414-C22]